MEHLGGNPWLRVFSGGHLQLSKGCSLVEQPLNYLSEIELRRGRRASGRFPLSEGGSHLSGPGTWNGSSKLRRRFINLDLWSIVEWIWYISSLIWHSCPQMVSIPDPQVVRHHSPCRGESATVQLMLYCAADKSSGYPRFFAKKIRFWLEWACGVFRQDEIISNLMLNLRFFWIGPNSNMTLIFHSYRNQVFGWYAFVTSSRGRPLEA